MVKKISKFIITVELILLVLALLGLGWIFIAFQVPKDIDRVLKNDILEERPELTLSPESSLSEEREVSLGEEKIVEKRRISPPAGFPQTAEEEKKFMEEIINPPKSDGKEKVKIAGETPQAF